MNPLNEKWRQAQPLYFAATADYFKVWIQKTFRLFDIAMPKLMQCSEDFSLSFFTNSWGFLVHHLVFLWFYVNYSSGDFFLLFFYEITFFWLKSKHSKKCWHSWLSKETHLKNLIETKQIYCWMLDKKQSEKINLYNMCKCKNNFWLFTVHNSLFH